MKLTFYKLTPNANIPNKATTGSACFDLEYQPHTDWFVNVYSSNRNTPRQRALNQNGEFTLMTGERVLIPTGLIANIPDGYSIRIHPRSGKSIKEGLTLVNAEGVIDSDYVEEIMITILNVGPETVIKPGNRLAQAELIENLTYDISETKKRPVHKTDRKGGFGSTGA